MNGPGEPHGGDVRENVRALIGLHRYEEAAAAARSGLRADPDDPGLATLLAIALCETDDAAGAVDVAQRAVALQPDASWGHQVLGWALYKAGRTAEGADQLAHALALDPHDSESHVMRGEILLEQADQAPRRTGHRNQMITQAERHAAEAVRLEPALAGATSSIPRSGSRGVNPSRPKRGHGTVCPWSPTTPSVISFWERLRRSVGTRGRLPTTT